MPSALAAHYYHCLCCPICFQAFDPEISTPSQLVCQQRHAFDIAREGYVNLLRKPLPGDTREMLIARRAFFDQGFYHPIVEQLQTLLLPAIAALASDQEPLTMLDAGCGEGYYLGSLQNACQAHIPSLPLLPLGLDISKEAIRLAARRYHEAFFIVANLKEPHLALSDASCRLILNIFAPRNPAEFARILSPGSLLCVVSPTPAHLHELRTELQLLSIEEQKQQHIIEQLSPYFTLQSSHDLSYTLQLDHQSARQLIIMTPNYWHLSPDQLTALNQIMSYTTTISISTLLFLRNPL